MRKCVDCGFWLSLYSCRNCGKPLCGGCVDWPSPRIHSPGKGMCSTCRKRPLALQFPIGRSGVDVPQAGQSNKALITLIKSIEREITNRTEPFYVPTQDATLAYTTPDGYSVAYPEMEEVRE